MRSPNVTIIAASNHSHSADPLSSAPLPIAALTSGTPTNSSATPTINSNQPSSVGAVLESTCGGLGSRTGLIPIVRGRSLVAASRARDCVSLSDADIVWQHVAERERRRVIDCALEAAVQAALRPDVAGCCFFDRCL